MTSRQMSKKYFTMLRQDENFYVQLYQIQRGNKHIRSLWVILTNIIQRVIDPVLSSIQDNRERLRNAYRRVIRISMLSTFVCMLALAAIAKPMALVLIGEKWMQSVYFLQIICFARMLYPLHTLNLNMLQAQGRNDLFLKLQNIKK